MKRERLGHGVLTMTVSGLMVGVSTIALAQQAQSIALPEIQVIGTTPVPGIGTPVNQVPDNVQTVTSQQIRQQHPLSMAQTLDHNIGSVNVNMGQENPFQPAVNYRGFTASPLLGTPEGLSVYLDGVRVNEAFGDVVNWDLIPNPAVDRIDVIPGSNPVFGLNTLGGALSITTKTGRSSPGQEAEVSGGSFGRYGANVSAGGQHQGFDYFLSGNVQNDDGWRKHSQSRVRQVYAESGYRFGTTSVQLDFIGADNSLHGTQALPKSFLNDPKQSYTWPDYTDNRLGFLILQGKHLFGDNWILSGNLYFRNLRTKAFDSNVSDGYDPNQPIGPNNSPGENDLAFTNTDSFGNTLQLTDLGDVWGRHNKLTMGVSADLGNTHFNQFAQAANFFGDRDTVGIAPFDNQVRLYARNRYYGLFATDTFTFLPRWDLTLAGRYNYARVLLRDRKGKALTGDHTFTRFNPSVGVNFHPTKRLTTYLNYNEGTRVPTPVELTCADPNAPCKLPNNFLADPSLKQVVAKTWTLGARGDFVHGIQWSAALFRTNVNNDIEFVSSGGASTSSGYFRNVPQTRREGVELGLHGRWKRLTWQANYTYLEATYQANFTERSPNNASADANGNIQVQSGDRIPGIPRHILKLRGDYAVTPKLSFGVSVYGVSDQYAYGNENNQDPKGVVPGYALFNLNGRYQATSKVSFFAQIDNLFNRDYYTYGALGENVFPGGGNTVSANPVSEAFLSPGAPRGAWVGMRIKL